MLLRLRKKPSSIDANRGLPKTCKFKSRLKKTLGVTVACAAAMLSAAAAQTISCNGRVITPLDFRLPLLESGVPLAVGSVYRFRTVATGIDSLVRIDALTNATLAIIDRDTGLIGNFQPELAGNGVRSADFTISFVAAGTTTPVALDLATSGIDIDGDSVSLREYSEFSRPFTEFVLATPTNLDVDASGPSVATNRRFESRTTFTAPGIDETATANIVSVLYTGTSSFGYRIGVLGSGNTVRLTSLDFTCPALPFSTSSPQVTQDFGDAPAAYGDPRHDIVTGIRLGSTNSAETAPYNSATASGDAGDDVVSLPALTQTQTSTVTISVVGAGGRLQAWFDWNGDGDFADGGESLATDVQDNGAGDTNPAVGTIGLSVTPPATATTAGTFARFRWSTQTGVNQTLTAPDGEVEDYAVIILAATPNIVLSKSVGIHDPSSSGLFATPGGDVIYTITASNSGTGPTDTDSVFLVDPLPAQIEFFNADIDGAGPATGPVLFAETGSGLTFGSASDLRYSNLTGQPASFAACAYTPLVGYDANVRHICFNPKGAFLSGTPAPTFSVQFRARIK